MAETIGDVIKYLREKNNLSQRKLAKKSGISHTMLSDIENMRSNPSLKTLHKISEALDIPISQIFLTAEYGQSVKND